MVISPDEVKLRQCKRFVFRGLALLGLGSFFLLDCLLPLSGIWHTAAMFAGGGALLLGNGYIIYGLLIFSDARTS